jgi:glyceraldehyde-3-phosphate dehydrogenase type I
MVVKIAINGFGRIGRLVFRAIRKLYPKECQVICIHDLCDIKTNAYLLKYDSAHRQFPEDVVVCEKEQTLTIGTGDNKWVVKSLGGRLGPSQLPWKDMGIDVVLESTGIFRAKAVVENGEVKKDGYDGHIIAGAKKVILSVPSSDAIDCTLVLGVNDEDLKPETKCISNASCTTNCLAPVAKTIHAAFEIVSGLMTTVHSYTNDQVVADTMHSDLRRARAAALNIIPTSTGAASALPKVVHSLPPKSLDGFALRVPTITGSLVDLTINVKAKVTKVEINAALKKATQEGPLKGIMAYTEDPIVSTDIIGDPHSSIIDSLSTMTIPNPEGQGTLVKILAWYDNEWGYSCRCADIMHRLEKYL